MTFMHLITFALSCQGQLIGGMTQLGLLATETSHRALCAGGVQSASVDSSAVRLTHNTVRRWLRMVVARGREGHQHQPNPGGGGGFAGVGDSIAASSSIKLAPGPTSAQEATSST